ncbi:MAG: DMSO reductase [Rubrivivax sp. SCN 70-15]|nr:MAG: DMSO reductase [Rubrivivax sp. SCN 70-15]
MRPAFSVILLTTLIGAGQGLFIAIVLIQTLAVLGLGPAAVSPAFAGGGSALALALLAAGLAASFFHLGRPERAWRSAAMWRTSWLAREVIALPAFMGTVALYGMLQISGWSPVLLHAGGPAPTIDLGLVVGLIGVLLALALFVCTGMIYACLRFLAEWHTPLTPLNYTLLGAASGFTLAAGFAAMVQPAHADLLLACAISLTILGAVGRSAALVRNSRLVPRSTAQTAIGVKHPRVVQRSMGFMGGSFNTREFFHGASPAWMRTVKPAFLLLAFVLPLLLLATGLHGGSPQWPLLAFAVQYVGLLAERWYFFAQANHPQNLYYQVIS